MKKWYKLNPSKKVHIMSANQNGYGQGLYLCGVGNDPSEDKPLPRKPRTGDFCKNCLRIDKK